MNLHPLFKNGGRREGPEMKDKRKKRGAQRSIRCDD